MKVAVQKLLGVKKQAKGIKLFQYLFPDHCKVRQMSKYKQNTKTNIFELP